MKAVPETTQSAAKMPLRTIDTYAAQCEKCFKWRIIDSQEEYEELRSKSVGEPFYCEGKPGLSCDVAADIEFNASRLWALDKHGLPKTPKGFKRSLVLRKDFSKMDAYYITPTEKKLRSGKEVAAFLDANPDYKDLVLEDFKFTIPTVVADTVPAKSAGKSSGRALGKRNKGRDSGAPVKRMEH